MPRKPVEKTVEHRITLGTYERTLLSNAIKSEQKNDLQQSAISATGSVLGSAVGSGALLYAVALYLGYSVFDNVKDGISSFTDKMSTGISTVLTEVTGGLNQSERQWFGARFDELDALIVENRTRDQQHAKAIEVLIEQAKIGEITYAEFQTLSAQWNVENQLIKQDREDILKARKTLLRLQSRAIAPSESAMAFMRGMGGTNSLAYYITSTFSNPTY